MDNRNQRKQNQGFDFTGIAADNNNEQDSGFDYDENSP